MILQLLFGLGWWLMLCVAAVLSGAFTLWLGFTVADAWSDRRDRRRVTGLRGRTLSTDLERIWNLPTADPQRRLAR